MDTATKAAKRLMMLLDIEAIIANPDTSDDEKWDTIRGMLRDSSLLIMDPEDEAALMPA